MLHCTAPHLFLALLIWLHCHWVRLLWNPLTDFFLASLRDFLSSFSAWYLKFHLTLKAFSFSSFCLFFSSSLSFFLLALCLCFLSVSCSLVLFLGLFFFLLCALALAWPLAWPWAWPSKPLRTSSSRPWPAVWLSWLRILVLLQCCRLLLYWQPSPAILLPALASWKHFQTL